MYEMYPDAWAAAAERHAPADAPRRRPRKEHSVLPPVLAHQEQLGLDVRRSTRPGH